MKTKPEFRKVVFEYDCICFFGSSYKLFLLEDGRLIREDYNISMPIIKNCLTDDFEDLVINSSDLVKAIKQLINDNKEELKSLLSKYIGNPGVCDGVSETFRFGRMKVQISLPYQWKAMKKLLKNIIQLKWDGKKDLLQFQRLFKKFQNKFHEYVEEPLFNGEDIEEEEE